MTAELAAARSAAVVETERRPARGLSTTIEPGFAEREPEAAHRRRTRLQILLGAIPPVLLLLAWQLSVHWDWLDGRLFSNPIEVGQASWELIKSGDLLDDTMVTVRRLMLGYVVGSAAGILMGLSIGRVQLLRSMFMPTISAVFTVPKLGLYPLLLLIFGLGELPRFLLVAFGAFLVVVLSTVDAASSVDRNYVDVATVFKARPLGRFFEVVLPATLPAIFTALRVSVGLSLLLVVATEFVQSREGLGFLIWNSWNLFQPEYMYVGLVTTALLGVVCYGAIGLLQRILAPWMRASTGRHGATL